MRARERLLETVTCVNEVIDMREREAEEVPVQGMGVSASQQQSE